MTIVIVLACIIVALPIAYVGFSVYTWSQTWKPYTSHVDVDAIEGDPSAPPTRWWNEWLLDSRGRDMTVIFEASEENFYPGYKAPGKVARVSSRALYEKRFRMKLPREYRAFFGINLEGKRIRLKMIARDVPVIEHRFQRLPLL